MLYRSRCSQSEVIRILDQRFPKMMHPDPIHPDAGRKRIRRRRDFIGEVESTAAGSKRLPILIRQDLQKPTRHRCSSLSRITALKDHRIVQHLSILQHHGAGRGR